MSLDALLTTRVLGRSVVFREEIESTNTLAWELADKGAAHGTIVYAGQQLAGRGRRGRSWLTLPGQHVYLSVILRPQLDIERAASITLVSAVALAEALESLDVPVRIKWPNDVELGGKKLSGILSELSTLDNLKTKFVIVGVGVNLGTAAEEFPPEIAMTATSVLASTGKRIAPETVIAAFLNHLEPWIAAHEQEGLAPVATAWRRMSSTLGARVRATLDHRVVEGIAEELDDTGALLVRESTGQLHRIVSGEVMTLRKAG
jgi:BirA family biotin operon repressor/biotin-[acetyl-CoA-carboxylase] ligase